MRCAGCEKEVDGDDSADAKCPSCQATLWLASSDERYALMALLGSGGTGVTFRARRHRDGAVVCLKMLRYRGLGSFKPEEKLLHEARMLKQLRHPAIPVYYDELTWGQGPTTCVCIVRELVEGTTLAEELATQRHWADDVVKVVRELCEVLAYLHGQVPPVIHRDLKPSNVIRRAADGRLVLVDLGSTRDLTPRARPRRPRRRAPSDTLHRSSSTDRYRPRATSTVWG